MPKRVGIRGEQWAICDRCGFEHPISMLSKQKGLMLCHDHGCYDKLDIERRPVIIAQILGDGREGEDPKAEKQSEEDPYADLMF